MPIIEFTYQGRTFRVVGTRRTDTGWDHSIKCIETGEYKWKSDAWLKHCENVNKHHLPTT